VLRLAATEPAGIGSAVRELSAAQAAMHALLRSWHPDAVFVALTGATDEPNTMAARDADLGGSLASLVVITDARRNPAAPGEHVERLVGRAAQARLPGGLLIVDSDRADILRAAMEVAVTGGEGPSGGYVWELRVPGGTWRILAVGRAVSGWQATRPVPEGAATRVYPVRDAVAARVLLERG
jgi:hypothetical protein